MFLTGDTDDGPDERAKDDFERSPRAIVADMLGGGITLPWTLIASIAIGVWLMFTRATLGTEGTLANADHLIGALTLTGSASLAVNNLLGGFTMQVAILAFADAVFRKAALTTAIPDPIVLLQGTLGIMLVALITAGIGAGDIAFLGAGLWTWGIFGVFLYAIRLVTEAAGHPSWEVIGQPPAPEIGEAQPDVEQAFNRDFRLMDVADELSNLALNCEFAGASFIGPVVFATHAE